MISSASGICTIIAKNYISFARALFQSIHRQHPDLRCFALIVDDYKGFLNPADEPFDIVSVSDISVPDAADMAFKYDVTEFSTAVKPFLLEYLFSKMGIEKLLYLDPDILVTNPLENLFKVLEKHEFLLTPHLDTDYPEDGLKPDDRHILISGAFNLGFLGIRRSQTSGEFLKWWQQKLKTKCIINHAAGYFVDQRFIDLAITLFPGFYFEKDTGYNVAYWNMHSRHLSLENGIWKSNGGLLYFFHFSAYKLEKPDLISSHANRFNFQNRPDVKRIFDEYKGLLIENGYLKTYQWPYTFGLFADGNKITYEMRARYRTALAAGLKISDPFQSHEYMEKKLTVPNGMQDAHRPVLLVKSFARNLTPPALWKCLNWGKNVCCGKSH
jgi:hypothetical protein